MKTKHSKENKCRKHCSSELRECEASTFDADGCAERWKTCVSACRLST